MKQIGAMVCVSTVYICGAAFAQLSVQDITGAVPTPSAVTLPPSKFLTPADRLKQMTKSELQFIAHETRTKHKPPLEASGAEVLADNGKKQWVLIEALSLYGETWVPLKPLSDALGCSLDSIGRASFSLTPPSPVTVQAPAPPPVQVEVDPKVTHHFTEQSSLGGIPSFSVMADLAGSDDLKQKLSGQGVTDAQIETDVKLKIRSSGITVTDRLQFNSLIVAVTPLATPDGGCCYSITVSFLVQVRLDNDLTCGGLVTGWEQSEEAMSPIDGIHANMSDQINSLVSAFCSDYLAANPITP